MDETSIDRLTLDIVVNNENAARRINNITKAIEKLNTAMGKSGNIDKVLDKINNVSPTSTRGGSTSGGGTKKEKDKNKSWTEQTYKINKFGQSILAQSVSVKKFNDTVSKTVQYFDEQGKSLKTITTEIDAYGNKVQKIQSFQDKQNKKTPKTTGKNNVNIFATMGKWNYMINMARYYGRSLANIVQLSMDYVETQNLWQVANRNNLEMAEQFIQKMNKAYGVSEATLMNYQAIFKNMLSALGDLSDEISSGLSMQLTQMALDFSSLYNVTIPSAMQKFQAVLSGQVRPIRSVSGYDITENTIFDLYSGAGGEKTMRQLSQIEKRLLRIVAVFDQMSATGATGDMAKTIESASNQARIMNEQFKETMTWTGQIILMGMESAGILKYINAMLITAKNIMKAIAVDLGYSDKNFLDNMVFSAEEAVEAVDEIQGKLLSFDKFEALNSKDSNILGIDQTVLDLLEKAKYETQEFEMEAQKLSETWTSWWVDSETGGLTKEAKGLLDVLKSIGITIGALLGTKLLTTIGSFIGKITNLTSVTKLFQATLATGVIYSIIKAVEAFREGDVAGGILATTIGVTLVGAMVLMELRKKALARATQYETMAQNAQNESLKEYNVLMANTNKKMASTRGALVGLATSMAAVALSVTSIVSNWDEMSSKQKGWVVAIASITAAVAALAFAVYAATQQWGKAISVAGGVITAGASVAAAIPMFKEGGFPEDGLFFANSGEMVGQFSNGRTAVANNDQIVTGITQGVYSAMMAYNAQTRGQGGSGDVYLDGTKVGRVVAKGSHQEMVRVGLIKANS